MMHIIGLLRKGDEKGKEALHSIITVASVIVWVLAIYLGIRDISHVRAGWTKFWVLALAVLMPELYVILHGIQSSAMGQPFFKGTPVESMRSMTDTSLGSLGSSSLSSLGETPSILKSTLSPDDLTPSSLSSY